jgi:DNA-binding transcriptional LysR family regulator
MDLRSVDLNLLVVFGALAEQRSVTRAAESLGLSQPATSAALARLRVLIGDPLFVKSGVEMRPTPRAAQLTGSVRQVLDTVRDEILMARAFEPAMADRQFTLLMPDIGEINFLPRLLVRLAQSAPQVRLRTRALARGDAAQALDNGTADLAIGYYPDLHRAGLFQQYLLHNRHVCIVRHDHPIVGTRMTLRQFQDAAHVVVRPDGRAHVFEQFLQSHGWSRHVRLEVSHFASLLPIVTGSDLIATIPEALAMAWLALGGIKVVATPMKVPVVEVHQFWHRRMHKDAAHMWLRAQVFDLFGEGSHSSRPPRAGAEPAPRFA